MGLLGLGDGPGDGTSRLNPQLNKTTSQQETGVFQAMGYSPGGTCQGQPDLGKSLRGEEPARRKGLPGEESARRLEGQRLPKVMSPYGMCIPVLAREAACR